MRSYLLLYLCDIELLQNFNDYYGHQQIDDALIQVSGI
ncbi:GGDEF domain-containing protein [Vibrio chagasii]|nr:GGDEF domain-containing protein [Vibrio chagasii]